MSPDIFTAFVDGCIPFGVGLWACVVGYDLMGKLQGRSEQPDKMYSNRYKIYRIGGPLLMVFGVLRAMQIIT